MIAISEIKAYDILKKKFKLSEEEAREVVAELATVNDKLDKELIEKVDDRFKNFRDIFLTKDDKVDLIKEIASTKTTLFWSLIVLFVPLYFTIALYIINNWKS